MCRANYWDPKSIKPRPPKAFGRQAISHDEARANDNTNLDTKRRTSFKQASGTGPLLINAKFDWVILSWQPTWHFVLINVDLTKKQHVVSNEKIPDLKIEFFENKNVIIQRLRHHFVYAKPVSVSIYSRCIYFPILSLSEIMKNLMPQTIIYFVWFKFITSFLIKLYKILMTSPAVFNFS